MKRSSILIAITILLIVVSSCLFPESFDSEITINMDGTYSFVYDGMLTIAAARETYIKGKRLSSKDEREIKEFEKDLLKHRSFKKVKYIGQGRFKVLCKHEGTLNSPFYFLNRELAFISIIPMSSNKLEIKGMKLTKDIMAKLTELKMKVDGEIKLTTDAKVIEHNAKSTPLLGKFGSYKWQIKSLNDPAPYMVLQLQDLKDRDKLAAGAVDMIQNQVEANQYIISCNGGWYSLHYYKNYWALWNASTSGRVPVFNALLEIKAGEYVATPKEITEVDKLNKIEWKGTVSYNIAAMRYYPLDKKNRKKDQPGWSEWINPSRSGSTIAMAKGVLESERSYPLFLYSVLKKDGRWETKLIEGVKNKLSCEAVDKYSSTKTEGKCHLQGKIFFGGKIISEYTSNNVKFWFRNETTGKSIDNAVGIYDNRTGSYRISGLPNGPIGISLSIHETGERSTFPGNYRSFSGVDLSTLSPTEATSHDLDVAKIIHLTEPFDNACYAPESPPYPEHTSPLRFTWEPITGESYYDVHLDKYRDSPYAFVENVVKQSTSSTSFNCTLPASEANTHYEFSVSAYPIAFYMTTYMNGHGWDYRFKINNAVAEQTGWKSQCSGTNKRLESVCFIDDKTGWVVGGRFGKSIILHTRDGGENWLAQNNLATLGLNSVCFVNAVEGWAVGGSCFTNRTSKGVILHTSNGGQTWELQKFPAHHMLHSVYFVDVNNGWAVGEDYLEANVSKGTSVILHTTNGGRSWVRQTVPPKAVGLKSVFFVNVNEGWASGQVGTIIHTNNGGKNWIVQNSGTKNWIYSIYFLDSNNGWAVTGSGGGGILNTSDGGNTWSVQTHGYSDLRSIYFADENHGYAVGPRGMIVNTADAGKTWHSQNIQGCRWLSSVFFTNPFLGWAVGAEGKIFKLQESIEGQTEMYVLFDTTETGILSPSAPRKVSGIDEWPANLTVTNNLDLWLEIVPGISKKGVVLKDVECLASKWQDKTFGKAGLRLLPPEGEIEYSVIYRKAKAPFFAEARFGDFAATLMITKVLATLPVPGIGQLDDPVTFLEFWEKVRKIDSIQEAASALKSGKIADASKKLISLLSEEKQLQLLRQAFAAFKIEVSKKAFINFLTISKISKVLNILGDQITWAIQSKAGAKPVRVSFHLEASVSRTPGQEKTKSKNTYDAEAPMEQLSRSMAEKIAASGIKTVAVVDFTDLQGNVTESGKLLAEDFSAALVDSDKGFDIVDKSRLESILKANRLTASGITDPNTAKKLGKVAGVDAIVTGTIIPFGNIVRTSAKLLLTQTGKVICVCRGNIPKPKAIKELLAKRIEIGSHSVQKRSAPPSATQDKTKENSHVLPSKKTAGTTVTERTSWKTKKSVTKAVFSIINCKRSGSYRAVRGDVPKEIDLGDHKKAIQTLQKAAYFAQEKCPKKAPLGNISVSLYQGVEIFPGQWKPNYVVNARNYDANKLTWREYNNRALRKRLAKEKARKRTEEKRTIKARKKSEAEEEKRETKARITREAKKRIEALRRLEDAKGFKSIPKPVRKVIFAESGFLNYITLDLPREDDPVYVKKVKNHKDRYGLPPLPFTQVTIIDAGVLSVLRKHGFINLEEFNLRSRWLSNKFRFLSYAEKIMPYIVEGFYRYKPRRGISTKNEFKIKIASRLLKSIDYKNENKALGIYSVAFSYTFQKEFSYYEELQRLHPGELPLINKTYKGKAKTYLDPNSNSWTLEKLILPK